MVTEEEEPIIGIDGRVVRSGADRLPHTHARTHTHAHTPNYLIGASSVPPMTMNSSKIFRFDMPATDSQKSEPY